MSAWLLCWQLFPILAAIGLGFVIGGIREQLHLRSLARREREFGDIGVVNLKTVSDPGSVRRAEIVLGQAVIATDYFKGIAAHLRGIVGGEIVAYRTLMDRARREALLRVLEEARALGAAEVWNIRFQTSNILSGGARRNSPSVGVEVLAFGTAIVRN